MAHSLVLIRHSIPQIDLDIPAAEWRLSDEGIKLCQPLSDELRGYSTSAIFHSQEPKARQTAVEISSRLGLACRSWPGLHEHDRRGIRFTSQAEFEQSVRALFNHPKQVVFGLESADQAYNRFSSAIERLLALNVSQDTFVVSHGTVISLFVSRRSNQEAFSLWKELSMPGAVILSLPYFRFVDLIKFPSNTG